MKIHLCLLVCAAACSPAVSRVTPQACPRGGVDPTTLVPVAQQPKPTDIFIPPLPIPNGVRGNHSTIRVVVDTVGRVIPDSVLVCGISDVAYSQRVADAVAALQFRPRQIAGRPVVSPALFLFDF